MIDDQNREIIIETTDLETFLKVSAFDVTTKREVMLMMPRDSTQEQITYLARKKLLYVLNKEGNTTGIDNIKDTFVKKVKNPEPINKFKVHNPIKSSTPEKQLSVYKRNKKLS